MIYETWYVLETGEAVHPSEVAPDDTGVLRHTSGEAVKMRGPGVPFTRGVYGGDAASKVTEDVKADDAAKPADTAKPLRRGYKTRTAD